MRMRTTVKRPPDDGIVPLINIVFLLLIFFLIVGTIAPSADISVAYPETEKSPVTRAPAEALYVSAGGFLSYRGTALKPEDLTEVVRADMAGREETILPVVVDRTLPARELAPLLGKLTTAGVVRIRLITVRGRGARGGGGAPSGADRSSGGGGA